MNSKAFLTSLGNNEQEVYVIVRKKKPEKMQKSLKT